MNPYLQKLQPYPFEKIRRLLAGTEPPAGIETISFAMGEPKHPPPPFVVDTLKANMDKLGLYPATRGGEPLRQAICQWLTARFNLAGDLLDPGRHVLPVNGTREALFSFAQAVIEPSPTALVVSPNPFYQIYEGATLLAGAEPWYLNSREENGFQPDFDEVPEQVWRHCQLVYLCSPGNPTGAVIPVATLQRLIELADRYDFIIASDECYSEIYPDEGAPPPGILEACAAMGRTDFARCVAFHSLSKRSNLPGLRSGFVAGDPKVLEAYLLYRTYHGCAMSAPIQEASIAAWGDESHVVESRGLYRRKFQAVAQILAPVMDIGSPDAGFYFWAKTPLADDLFTRELYRHSGVQVVPGTYLARDTKSGNPGRHRVRMALVAGEAECSEGARRIRQFIETL